MKKSLLLLLLVLPAYAFPVEKPGEKRKVFLIAIDGVRHREAIAPDVLPTLHRLRKESVFYPEMRISNPAGISLPAYGDVFAGRRQDRILDNDSTPPISDHPTIFEAVKRGLGLGPDGVALFSSWGKLCPLSATKDSTAGDFFKSCGWQPGKFFKPEVYEGSRTDADTFIEMMRELPKRHPTFAFVHLGDADEEAHLHQMIKDKSGGDYGVFPYRQALRQADHFIGRLWAYLQEDPFYRGSTYLIVFTDHGRDDVPSKDQWWNHGACKPHNHGKLCEGCQHVFAQVIGPGLRGRQVPRRVSHADLAPTVAALLGVELPTATGTPLEEVIAPVRGKAAYSPVEHALPPARAASLRR